MYRPKDWDEQHKKLYPHWNTQYAHTAYEAGADAMLEELWKMAKESPTGEFSFDSNFNRA